jgi:hypothetical protein
MKRHKFKVPTRHIADKGKMTPQERFMVEHEILGTCEIILSRDTTGTFDKEWGLRVYPLDIKQGTLYNRHVSVEAADNYLGSNGFDILNKFAINAYVQAKMMSQFYLRGSVAWSGEPGDWSATVQLTWARPVSAGGPINFQKTWKWVKMSLYEPFNKSFPSSKLHMSKDEYERWLAEENRKGKKRNTPTAEMITAAQIRLK